MTSRLTSFGLEPRFSEEDRRRTRQKTAFKFFSKGVAPEIFDQGSILIGTGSGYRSIESASRVDKGEMSTSMFNERFIDDPINRQADNLPQNNPLRELLVRNRGPSRVEATKNTFVTEWDFYVYCFSYECTPEVARSFSDNADCVAQITDIEALAEVLVAYHPKVKGMKYCIYPVIYTPRLRSQSEAVPTPFDAAFEKDPVFSANREGRIVFYDFDIASMRAKAHSGRLARPTPVPLPDIRALFKPWPYPG